MPEAKVVVPALAPVTVTVCGVFQLADVNVTLAGDTVPSLVLLDDSPMVTLASGWLDRKSVV